MKEVFVFGFLLFFLPSFSQSIPNKQSQNTIYGTVNVGYYRTDGFSTDISFGGVASLSYERFILTPKDKLFSSLRMKLYYGLYHSILPEEDITGGIYSIGATALTGHNTSHLEFGIGIQFNDFYENKNSIYYHRSMKYFRPQLNMGYRFQKIHSKSIVFRAGIGIPEVLYMSLGYSF
jgi:hypothetical protein